MGHFKSRFSLCQYWKQWTSLKYRTKKLNGHKTHDNDKVNHLKSSPGRTNDNNRFGICPINRALLGTIIRNCIQYYCTDTNHAMNSGHRNGCDLHEKFKTWQNTVSFSIIQIKLLIKKADVSKKVDLTLYRMKLRGGQEM